MPKQDIIVIGGSAGALEALRTIVAGLPATLNAAIFVVIHIGVGTGGKSFLPEILRRAGSFPVKDAVDGEEILHGQMYCACPNFHLELRSGRVRVVDGPKENFTRPAINPLFRSAAAAYGQRVTGVIVSGTLDDGVGGLAEIKRKRGLAIVQRPSSAQFPAMPRNAIQDVQVDYVAELEEIAPLLVRLTEVERDPAEAVVEEIMSTKTRLTCPECRGPLTEERQGTIIEFQCRVGHVFTKHGLKKEHDATLERTIYEAMVALEEGADISEIVEEGDRGEARLRREHADTLKKMLEQLNRLE